MHRIALVAVGWLCCAIPFASAARSDDTQNVAEEVERERRIADLKRYHALIDSYQGGANEPVKQIAAWETKRLEKIVAAVETQDDPLKAWPKDRFKTAAMLHTDAANERLYEDETRVGFELELASMLLHKAGPELNSFSRDWYPIVARVLRGAGLLSVAERFLEGARKRLPRDAVVLYESGILQEQIASFAAFFTEAAAPVTSFPRPQPGAPLQNHASSSSNATREAVLERRRALNDAAKWLTDSVGADSRREPAQLHLARVQMLRENTGDALKLLERLAASTEADTSYLAVMFTAAIHARRGDHARAEQKYRIAVEKLPDAQSAYVALSETLRKLGRGEEAREVLEQLLQRTPKPTADPWWWYLADRQDEVRRRLSAVRAAVRK